MTVSKLAPALALLLTCTAATESAAQGQILTVNLGYFALRGEDSRVEGDVLNADRCLDFTGRCEPLLFDVGDFNGVTIGAEYLVGLTEYIEAGVGLGFYQRTVPSIYEELQEDDGTEIEQDLKLRIVPVTFTARFLPFGRDGAIQPYIGAGLGLFRWNYSEVGEFVDTRTFEIFRARFTEDGTAAGPVIVGGVRAPIGDDFLLGGELRFQRAEGELSEDFLGDRIDLGGFTYQVVFGLRF